MPEISRFLGIVIGMFYREHGPPHLHAAYGEYRVTVELETGKVAGQFPKRALGLVQEWREKHKQELLQDWELARHGKPLVRIAPLE